MPAGRTLGYTIVELLVVIAILALLSVTSAVYYRSLTSDKILLKGIDSVQSLLRTAQSNAASGFSCTTTAGATIWFVQFRSDDKTKIDLYCVDPGSNSNINRRTLTLENLQVSSIKGSGCTLTPQFNTPVKVSFAPLFGKVSFSGGDTCIADSSTLTIILKSAGSNDSKSFTISSGGAVNVQ